MSDDLQTSVKDGIARMNINRPAARNAMTGPIIQEMIEFCRGIENDPAVRVLSASWKS
jgi:enoyl-CoA hydratase/carnithine racemase